MATRRKVFQIGDVTSLKSGGPRMVVVKVEDTGEGVQVSCAWHIDAGPCMAMKFPAACLR